MMVLEVVESILKKDKNPCNKITKSANPMIANKHGELKMLS